MFIDRKTANERFVDLQPRNRERLQRTEAGIAGAEVVDRQLNAEALQSFHGVDRLRHVLHDQAFGQFKLEILGFQAAILQCADDLGEQVLVAELSRRDVDRNVDERQPCLLPGLVLPARLA